MASQEALRIAMRFLDREEHALVEMRYFAPYSVEEIAVILGVSIDEARDRLDDVLSKLRSILA